MKTLKLVFLLLFAVALPAQAVWTNEERVELRKIVQTALVVQDVLHDLAEQSASMPNPKDVQPALHSLHFTSMNLWFSFSAINGECCASTREGAYEQMIRFLDGALRNRSTAVERLNAIGKTALAQRLAEVPIDTFHRGLAYADQIPAAAPNIIGPHGDYVSSLAAIEHGVQYIHHSQFDLMRMWQNSDGSVPAITKALRMSAETAKDLWRIFAINADAALADDEALAVQDSQFGTGLRPPSFFRVLIAIEYFNADGKTIFSGRKSKVGATLHMRQMTTAAASYLQSLAIDKPEELAKLFLPGSSHAHGASGTNTWAKNFFDDLADFWRVMDVWNHRVIGFFRPPPAPPSGSEPDESDEELQAQIDALTVERNLLLEKIELALDALSGG